MGTQIAEPLKTGKSLRKIQCHGKKCNESRLKSTNLHILLSSGKIKVVQFDIFFFSLYKTKFNTSEMSSSSGKETKRFLGKKCGKKLILKARTN